MKSLLAVVLASACGGAVPQPVAPVIEYPRGAHALDQGCNLARIGRSIDYNVITCSFIYRH